MIWGIFALSSIMMNLFREAGETCPNSLHQPLCLLQSATASAAGEHERGLLQSCPVPKPSPSHSTSERPVSSRGDSKQDQQRFCLVSAHVCLFSLWNCVVWLWDRFYRQGLGAAARQELSSLEQQ